MEKINYVLTGNCKVIKSQNTYHQNCILLPSYYNMDQRNMKKRLHDFQ